MNFLKNKLIFKKNVKLIHNNAKLRVINNTSSSGYIVFLKPLKEKFDTLLQLDNNIKIIKGNIPELILLNRKRNRIKDIILNSTSIFNTPSRLCFLSIKIPANTELEINKLEIKNSSDVNYDINNDFNSDVLLLVPGYPSESNKYLFAFVHTRVKEYLKSGINVDVAYVNADQTYTRYNYDGINVMKISFFDIRNILQVKKYKKIIVHFFNEKMAQLLDATDIHDTDIYLFVHGSDILYRDMNKLTCPYFKHASDIDTDQEKNYLKRDEILKKYCNNENVMFIFPSKWAKERSEKLNHIKFNNFDIIPTYINSEIFKYHKKNKNDRKKIVIIRKYDNINTYSIDTDVRTILELSRKDYFNDLEFNIYGDGDYHDTLLSPIKKFSNVHIYKKFLSHDEIAKVHKENGIGLFATRYETFGVSAAEAMSSGLVVISNDVAAVSDMFSNHKELVAKDEDYIELASIIEYLYKNPDEYLKLSEQLSREIKNSYGYENTIKKELKILNKKTGRYKYSFKKKPGKKLLTIGVACYNVEKYLYNGIDSLLRSKYADKIEILIVNDGSKDNTVKIANDLCKIAPGIVKLIDKENGGHGSTINAAIEHATGKYFKLMDGDDYFDTASLDKLIEILEKENSDIILNNYVEDLSLTCEYNPIHHYDFMSIGKKYNIEDLCYPNYGFTGWGPLLSTSTFKTDMLKSTNFKISEKCFYVDMELNSIAFSYAKSVTYYPLDIYIYYLGRVGQSVSAASFKRNYKNHEKVTLRIIKDIYYSLELNNEKKQYLKNMIILPLIEGQYYITTEYFDNGKAFTSFDKALKKYPEFYNSERIINRRIKIYRFTHGKLVRLIKLLVKLKHIIVKK